MLMLDTDVLIDFQRGFAPSIKWFSQLAEIPSVSGLVIMELLQDARNRTELEQSLKMVAALNVTWPTQEECLLALSLFIKYHLSHSLGLIDAFIASMAIVRDAELNTFNIKHYRPITELQCRTPYAKR